MGEPEESPSSLAELEALAGLDGTPSPSADDGTGDDPADFDLSRLAASAAISADASEPSSDASSDDDKLDLGMAGRAAANAAAVRSQAPDAVATSVIAPVVASPVQASPARGGSSGFAWGLVAGIAVAGALFLLLRSPTETTPSRSTSLAATPTVSATAAAAPSTVATAKAAAASSDGVAAPLRASALPAAPLATPASATATAPPRASTTSRPVGPTPVAAHTEPTEAQRGASTESDPTRPPLAAPTEAPATPSRPIDSLLDDALGSGKGTKQAKAAPDNMMGQDLPATPTAADVTQVIQVLLPAIRGCAMGQSGVANTLLVVRNDGGVATASITGAPYAGAASGRCMEGVLRRAKFPRFRQSVFRVQFPLSIRASS